MQTIYLKAANKEAFEQSMVESNLFEDVVIDGTAERFIKYFNNDFEFDVIGEIYVKTGNIVEQQVDGTDEIFEMEEEVLIDGHHVNVIIKNGPNDANQITSLNELLPAPLRKFIINTPSAPHRKWAE